MTHSLLHLTFSGTASPLAAATFECAACHKLVPARLAAPNVDVWARSPEQCTRSLSLEDRRDVVTVTVTRGDLTIRVEVDTELVDASPDWSVVGHEVNAFIGRMREEWLRRRDKGV